MSIKYMAAVWEITEISGTDKLVLLALADNSNDDGIAWPGMNSLARRCGVTRRYIISILDELEQNGFIQITRRKTEDTHKNNTNLYKLTIPIGEKQKPNVVNPSSLGVVNYSSPGVVNPSSPRGEPQFTRVVNYSSPEPSVNHHITTLRRGENSDELDPLTIAFCTVTGYPPYVGGPEKWMQAVHELEKLNANAGDIKLAVEQMRKGGKYAISNIGSIVNWVRKNINSGNKYYDPIEMASEVYTSEGRIK